MLRRALALGGAALALAGCAGESGLRAQELLERSAAAQERLTSSTFEGSVAFTLDGQRMSLLFTGASADGGEWFSMRTHGIPDAPELRMQMLVRGKDAWLDLGEGWQAMPAPPSAAANGTVSGAAFQRLAEHVKAVRVTEGQLVGGKPVTTIAGEIDTEGLLAAASELAGMANQSFDLGQLGISFGDIDAVLTIDERTHLLDSAYVTLTVGAKGKQAKVELRYRLTGANEPVQLPAP